jgi:hypothetical protein
MIPRLRMRDHAGMPYDIAAHILEVKAIIKRDKASEWRHVTAQGKAFLEAMTASEQEYLELLLQEEQLRRMLPPFQEIFTTCKACHAIIQWSLVNDNPELHAHAAGTREDPLAPGSWSDVCQVCEEGQIP